MKKLLTNSILASALLIGSITINSCGKVEDIIDNITIPVPFAINVNKNNIDTPLIVSTQYIKSPNIPLGINLDQEIKNRFQNMSSANVKSAKLASFSITQLSSTSGTKLNAISDAQLVISASNLPDKIIATVSNNVSAETLNFTPVTTEPDSELMDYLKSQDASIYLNFKGPENKVDQMKVNINSSFKIQVGLK